MFLLDNNRTILLALSPPLSKPLEAHDIFIPKTSIAVIQNYL